MKKSTLILLISVGVLALVYFLVQVGAFAALTDLVTGRPKDIEWKSLDEKTITKIEIARAENPTTVELKDGKWYMMPETWKVAETTYKRLLEVLGAARNFEVNLEGSALVTYELDDAKAVTVKAYAKDKVVREFKVGKADSNYGKTFVMVPGNKAVYKTSGNFATDFRQQKNDMREKRILSFSQDAVKGAFLTNANGVTAEVKKPAKPQLAPGATPEPNQNNDWLDKDGKPVDQEAFKDILSSLTSLTANGFLDEKTADLKSQPIRLKMRVITDTSEYEVAILTEKRGDEYRCWSGDSDFGFTMTSYWGEKLEKDIEKLVK